MPGVPGCIVPLSKKDEDSILQSWYGPERALDERISRNPQLHPFSEALDKYMKGVVSEGAVLLDQISDEWGGIVGAANAKLCRPVFFRDGVLKVEINHPAFKLALDNPKMKTAITTRLEQLKITCTSIQFIPPGSFKKR